MIPLPAFTERELQRKAVTHRNARNDRRFRATVGGTSPQALIRWQVNYVRHVYTTYDESASPAKRVEINRAIGERYPWLAQETHRQTQQRQRDLFLRSLQA